MLYRCSLSIFCSRTARRIRSNLSTHAQKVSTELLARLRKSTGYPILKCRRALLETGNDLQKAEAWLADEAQREGWTRVEQLQSRKTSHGLVAVKTEKTYGVMVEVNCETDFVSRNETFQGFVGMVTQSFFTHYEHMSHSCSTPVSMFEADGDILSSLSTPESSSIGDQLAKTVGRLSEKVSLRRGVALSTAQGVVVGYSHGSVPRVVDLPCSVGSYGALVALQGSESEDAVRKLGSRIGMQVVGTNPKGMEPPHESKTMDKQDWLLSQQFLFDNSVMIQEMLESHGATIFGFLRYSCGDD